MDEAQQPAMPPIRLNPAPLLSALLLLFTATAPLPARSQMLDYRAPLQPVNPAVTEAGLTGKINLVHRGDQLEVIIETSGLAPDMLHLQHLHGSRDGMDARCPPMGLETEHDEIVDLFDTRPYSGITLIPLHDDPASLELQADTYPVSNRAGGYTYRQTIDLSVLKQAMADQYGIDNLELGKMVVYVHGVSEDTELPESVRSLPGAPVHMTLPVACGELDIQPVHR